MKRSGWVTCSFIVLTISLLVVSSAAQAQQKTITLNYSIFPATHRRALPTSGLKKKRTNGLVKQLCFTEAHLLPRHRHTTGGERSVRHGAGCVSYHRGRFPLTNSPTAP
jgi:hypothetical protein